MAVKIAYQLPIRCLAVVVATSIAELWCLMEAAMKGVYQLPIWCSPEVILAEAAGELTFLSDFVAVEAIFVFFAGEEEAAALGEEGRMMVRITDLIVFDCEVPEFASP